MNKAKVKINGRQVFKRATTTVLARQDAIINGRQVYICRHIKQIRGNGNESRNN